MKEKLSEKELALFQAVIDLIEEDVDIHPLKYLTLPTGPESEKGTAYEYFSSKEEMVARPSSGPGRNCFRRSWES